MSERTTRAAGLARVLSKMIVIIAKQAPSLVENDIFCQIRYVMQVTRINKQFVGNKANAREKIAIVRHLPSRKTHGVDECGPGFFAPLGKGAYHCGGYRADLCGDATTFNLLCERIYDRCGNASDTRYEMSVHHVCPQLGTHA